MTILWFWSGLVAAVFALSAYNQASEPGWRIGAGAMLLGVLALGYVVYALPPDLSYSDSAFGRHPDALRFRVGGFVFLAASICVLGAGVGSVFRDSASAGRIGLVAFAGAFVGFQVLVFSLAGAR